MRLSGSGQSAPRLLSGAFTLRVRLDAPAYVAVETMTPRGWQPLASAKGEMQASEQLIRFTGELVRLVSEGSGTVEIVMRDA